MRTLDARSIRTFKTKMTMFRGVNASLLSLLLKNLTFYRTTKEFFLPDFDDREGDSYKGEEYR